MRPDRSGGGPYMDAEEDYGDGGQRQQRQHRDPVATLYAPVLPNAHPVRLEGKQHPRKEGQLPPLNPLYVRRFAADIARDAVGRQYEALAALLPRLGGLCPRELAALLAHVVEVFARTPSPTYRTLLLGFLEAADWPLLAAATAAGPHPASSAHGPSLPHLERPSVSSYMSRTPGGISRMGSTAGHHASSASPASPAAAMGRALYALVEETGAYDTRTRALAWRALGLLAEPSHPEHVALVDRLLTWALPSVVPEEPQAAASALHALGRRHPPLLRVLLPTLERVLGGAQVEEGVAVELMKMCRYTPLASLSSKERKALWMQLRDIVLDRALLRLAHAGAVATGLGCLATMAGTRIMRRRILRSGTVDTALALVSEEHQEALAPILLTILSYARDGAALSEELAAHAAALSVELARALPAAPPGAASDKPSLHQRLIEQAAAALLAHPPPQHEAGYRHRALFLHILGAAAAAHRQPWAGPVVDSVLLHDDLLALVTQPSQGRSSSNGVLVLAWCRALAAALGSGADAGGASSSPREAKAQAAMGNVIAALLERVRVLLPSPAPDDADALADALDALLALASAGRRAPLEVVLTGALALLRQQQQQPASTAAAEAAAAAEPLVVLVAALAAVDAWGVVEAAVLGSEWQLLLLPAGADGQGSDGGGRELAAAVALLRAARGTAADQQPVLALFMGSAASPSSTSTAAPDAMDVDGQGQGQAQAQAQALFPAHTPALAASGWGRYRLAREAFLHGYFPLAHSLLAPLRRPAQQTEATGLWLGALAAISGAEAALLAAASPISTASPALDRREDVELAAVRPALRRALALMQRLEDGVGGGAAAAAAGADDGTGDGGGASSFNFARRFLQTRLELLLLLATLRAAVRELQLGGKPPGHKATRHHRHHTRLPLAFRRLEGRLWRLYCEGRAHDAQTRWTLRAVMGLAAFLRRAVQVLVLQQPPTAAERSRPNNPHWPAAPANPANRLPVVAVARALEARVMQEVAGPTDAQDGVAAGAGGLPSLQASLALMAQVEASLAAVPWPYPRLFLHPPTTMDLWSLRLVAWGLGPEDVVAAARERPLSAAPPASASMLPSANGAASGPPPLRPHSSSAGSGGGSLSRAPSTGSGHHYYPHHHHHHYPHQSPGLASTSSSRHGHGGAASLGMLHFGGGGGEECEEAPLLEMVQGQPASFAAAGVIKGLPAEALAVAHVKLTATVLRQADDEDDEDDDRAGAARAKRWSSAGGHGGGRRRRRSSGGAAAAVVAAAMEGVGGGVGPSSSSYYYREVLAVPLCPEDGTFPGATFRLPANALPRPGEYTLLLEALLVDGGGRSWLVPQGGGRGGEEDGRLLASILCVSPPLA